MTLNNPSTIRYAWNLLKFCYYSVVPTETPLAYMGNSFQEQSWICTASGTLDIQPRQHALNQKILATRHLENKVISKKKVLCNLHNMTLPRVLVRLLCNFCSASQVLWLEESHPRFHAEGLNFLLIKNIPLSLWYIEILF